jgi:hypothetical protein
MSHVVARRAALYPFKVEGGRAWYLVLRRAESVERPGTWEAVRTDLGPTDTAAGAVVAALQHLTALEQVSLWSLDHVEQAYDAEADEVVFCPCFTALVAGDLVLSAVHDASRWLSPREAANTLGREGPRVALDVAHRHVGQVCAAGAFPDPTLRVHLASSPSA